MSTSYIQSNYDNGEVNRPAKQMVSTVKAVIGSLKQTDLVQERLRNYVDTHVSDALEDWIYYSSQLDIAAACGRAVVLVTSQEGTVELGIDKCDKFSFNVTMNMETFRKAMRHDGGPNEWVADKLSEAGVKEVTVNTAGPLIRTCYKQAMLDSGHIAISDLEWLLV